MPRSVQTASGLLIIYPGGVGLPAYDDHPYPQSSHRRKPAARSRATPSPKSATGNGVAT